MYIRSYKNTIINGTNQHDELNAPWTASIKEGSSYFGITASGNDKDTANVTATHNESFEDRNGYAVISNDGSSVNLTIRQDKLVSTLLTWRVDITNGTREEIVVDLPDYGQVNIPSNGTDAIPVANIGEVAGKIRFNNPRIGDSLTFMCFNENGEFFYGILNDLDIITNTIFQVTSIGMNSGFSLTVDKLDVSVTDDIVARLHFTPQSDSSLYSYPTLDIDIVKKI